MVRMQFDYYVEQYRLKKQMLKGEETFSLYGMSLTFHEHLENSYATVTGNIPYLLVKDLPGVDPSYAEYLDASHPSSSGFETWVFGKCFGKYLIEQLPVWKSSKDITSAEMIKLIDEKKKALLTERPEEFYLSMCHFFAIDGLTTFLQRATDFYTKK